MMRFPLVLLFAFAAQIAVGAAARYTERDVLGHWTRGGFGYFTKLTLSPDHTYKAQWSGDDLTYDDGVYGRASGRWKLEGDLLITTARHTTKEIKRDLPALRLVRYRGKLVLAPTRRLPLAEMFHLDPNMVFERAK